MEWNKLVQSCDSQLTSLQTRIIVAKGRIAEGKRTALDTCE